MLLNTEIKHSIPGNPPSLGALQGTPHNTEVSAPSPGGAPTHTVYTQNLLAHVHLELPACQGPRCPQLLFSRPLVSLLALLPADLAVNPGPNPPAVVDLVFCPGGEVSTETEAQ